MRVLDGERLRQRDSSDHIAALTSPDSATLRFPLSSTLPPPTPFTPLLFHSTTPYPFTPLLFHSTAVDRGRHA